MLQGFVSVSNTGKVFDIFKKQYKKYPNKKVSTEDTGKMVDFVLKNNLFEFDFKFYTKISGTAIGTKLAFPYACIFMDHNKTEFFRYKILVLEGIH